MMNHLLDLLDDAWPIFLAVFAGGGVGWGFCAWRNRRIRKETEAESWRLARAYYTRR